jgi:hypothetical protein
MIPAFLSFQASRLTSFEDEPFILSFNTKEHPTDPGGQREEMRGCTNDEANGEPIDEGTHHRGALVIEFERKHQKHRDTPEQDTGKRAKKQ